MNNQKRKAINTIVEALQGSQTELEELQATEEEARDNLPESLIDSEQYEKIDNACNELEFARDELDTVLEHLQEAAQ